MDKNGWLKVCAYTFHNTSNMHLAVDNKFSEPMPGGPTIDCINGEYFDVKSCSARRQVRRSIDI